VTLVLWFSQLQPGVTPEEYERFVRAVDYPATAKIPSIIRYYSLRVTGPATGDAELPFDFIDIAEITDIDAYRKDLEQHPAALEVHGQFERYVKSVGNFWAIRLDDQDVAMAQKPAAGLTPQVVWFSRLQPRVDPADYERWVREVDYPGAQQLPSLVSYRVYPIKGPCLGDSPALFDSDYVEIAIITSMADYLRDLEEHPAAQAIIGEIGQYVQSVGSAWGIPVAG
jgi:hypothetical protein